MSLAQILGAAAGPLVAGVGSYLAATSRDTPRQLSGTIVGLGLGAAGTVLTAVCAQEAARLPRRINEAVEQQSELAEALERFANSVQTPRSGDRPTLRASNPTGPAGGYPEEWRDQLLGELEMWKEAETSDEEMKDALAPVIADADIENVEEWDLDDDFLARNFLRQVERQIMHASPAQLDEYTDHRENVMDAALEGKPAPPVRHTNPEAAAPSKPNPRASEIVHKTPPSKTTRWFVPGTTHDGRTQWDKRLVEQSGVYAVRDRETGEVLYVGSSYSDRLKYTLTRKYQSWPATKEEDPAYSRDATPYRGAVGHRGSRLLGEPGRTEVRVWYVPSDEALALEGVKRAELAPRYDAAELDDASEAELRDAEEADDLEADATDFDPSTFENPSAAQVADAVDASTDFHWGETPAEAREVDLPAYGALYELGKLRELTYETSKGGERALWEHKFTDPYPSVTATPDGTLGPIVGGAAVVTERGIEG